MKRTVYILLIFCGYAATAFGQKKPGMLEYTYNATVKIQTVDSAVKKAGAGDIIQGENGTGLFFVFETDKGQVPVIVTNRHVIRSAVSITLFFLEADNNDVINYAKQQKITFRTADLPMFYHPDENIDLAIIPINPILAYLAKQKINISFHPLGEAFIPKDSIANMTNPMEELFMLSHPAALQNELNGRPLLSKGITATPLFLDHNNRKEFLADLTSYDGSAGAPVILYQANNLTRYDERMSGHRIILAGIYTASFSKGLRERIYPGHYPATGETAHENIGVVIKSQKLLDFKKVLNALNK